MDGDFLWESDDEGSSDSDDDYIEAATYEGESLDTFVTHMRERGEWPAIAELRCRTVDVVDEENG